MDTAADKKIESLGNWKNLKLSEVLKMVNETTDIPQSIASKNLKVDKSMKDAKKVALQSYEFLVKAISKMVDIRNEKVLKVLLLEME